MRALFVGVEGQVYTTFALGSPWPSAATHGQRPLAPTKDTGKWFVEVQRLLMKTLSSNTLLVLVVSPPCGDHDRTSNILCPDLPCLCRALPQSWPFRWFAPLRRVGTGFNDGLESESISKLDGQVHRVEHLLSS